MLIVLTQRTAREMRVWKYLDTLNHPNILPFLGMYKEGDFKSPNGYSPTPNTSARYLVSPWANEGNIRVYFNRLKAENKPLTEEFRLKLVRKLQRFWIT